MGSETNTFVVYYFIPSDGDCEEYPNAFKVKSANRYLTVRQVKNSFPLPGVYYFRFKVRFGDLFAWLDLKNDDDIIPFFGDAIISKVLRLNWEQKSRGNQKSTSSKNQPTQQVIVTPQTGVTHGHNSHCHLSSGIQPPPPPPSHPPPPGHPKISPHHIDLIDLNSDHQKHRRSAGYI